MNNFLNPQEKIQLRQVLAKSSQLRSPEDRTQFLTFCGLEQYCTLVQIEQIPDKFSISIYNELCKDYITVLQGVKLALVIFLEYLTQLDSSLSQEDKKFIEYIINKG